jgi:outer membrane PBP1 activator LpoA protein
MNSSSLGAAAESVRAGFMTSVERDGAGVTVDLVPTGDNTDGTLASYAEAAASHDVVVGPLARPAVSALAATGALSRPTVALNHPEPRGNLPRGMVVAGLSIEDEARQAAEWAAREHPQGRVLILTSNAAWAQRAAGAFEARWDELGHTGQRFDVPSVEGRVDPSVIADLKTRLGIDPPALLFAALDVVELRQVRAQTGTAIPCYAGSAGNPGRAPGMTVPELDGLRVVDLPWLVQPDAPAVMVYPRPLESDQSLTMNRLYALGIDAFLVARELALRPGAPFVVDGVTGHLEADPGASRLQRREAMAVYRGGDFEPANAGP